MSTITEFNLQNNVPLQIRKVIIQRAGGFFRARYAGMTNNCFGETPNEATKRLKFFGDSPNAKFTMGVKYE